MPTSIPRSRRAPRLPKHVVCLMVTLLGVVGSTSVRAEPDAGCVPTPEACDCVDSDCDGVIDNVNPPGLPGLCAPGSACVTTPHGCACASPCTGENDCPFGFDCDLHATSSETGADLGPLCVIRCDHCEQVEDVGEDGYVECAPEGTMTGGCHAPPVCACRWPHGCKSPCFLVKCGKGTTCAKRGPEAGTCVPDDCDHVPCEGCNQTCVQGKCVTNPCGADSCGAGEICIPDADGPGFTCAALDAGGGATSVATSGATGGAGGGAGGGPTAFGGCGCDVTDADGGVGARVALLALAMLTRVRRRARAIG